jgi:hypothetical protein
VSGAIELFQFNAVRNGKDVDVKWLMMNELSNTHVEIERSTNGFSNFIKIGTVASVRNVANINTYNFKDLNPQLGENYYRLRCYMSDGSNELSWMRVVTISEADEFEFETAVLPNPFETTFNLNMSEHYNYTVKIRNSVGELVQDLQFSGRSQTIDLSAFANGVYYITINNSKKQQTKLVVKN